MIKYWRLILILIQARREKFLFWSLMKLNHPRSINQLTDIMNCIPDIRHRCRPRRQCNRSRSLATMGSPFNCSLSRRPCEWLYRLMAWWISVFSACTPKSTWFAWLAKSTISSTTWTVGNGIPCRWEGIWCHSIAWSRRWVNMNSCTITRGNGHLSRQCHLNGGKFRCLWRYAWWITRWTHQCVTEYRLISCVVSRVLVWERLVYWTVFHF